MQIQFELGHDAEVPAAAAQPPKEVAVFVDSSNPSLSVDANHVGHAEIVAGSPEASEEPSEAAAEREAGDANPRMTAQGGHESVGVSGAIQIAGSRAGSDARSSACRVDVYRIHQRQIDHDAVVADRRTEHVMTTATYRDLQRLRLREFECANHIVAIRAPGDNGWMLIGSWVQAGYGSCLIVAVVARDDDGSFKVTTKSTEPIGPATKCERQGSGVGEKRASTDEHDT